MDWSSLLLGFGSAVIGGLSTTRAGLWLARHDLRAAGMAALEELDDWTEPPSSRSELGDRMRKHREGRAAFLNAGVSIGVIEKFNFSTLAYSAWALAVLPLASDGLEPTDQTDKEKQISADGEQLWRLSRASQAAIAEMLRHPVRGRLRLVLF